MKKNIISFLLVFVLALSLVSAADIDEAYQTFSQAVENSDVSAAMDAYSDLMTLIDEKASEANKSIDTAIKKKDRALFQNASSTLKSLNEYSITTDQNDALLTAILAMDEGDEKTEAIDWLYKNSYSYTPRLSYAVNVEGTNYKLNSSSSIMAKPGSEITLPDAQAIKANASVAGTLVGWGITLDEISYQPGETVTMPATSQTLYAIFAPAVSFIDAKSETKEVTYEVTEGDTVTVPTPATSDGAVFAGWYDPTSGQFLSAEASEYTVKGSGASFTGLWQMISIPKMKCGNYSPDALPTGMQIPLSFTLSNTGTENLRSLSIVINTDAKDVTLINTKAYAKGLNAGRSLNITGTKMVIGDNLASGSEIPVRVTVTDGDGNVYTSQFTCKVK